MLQLKSLHGQLVDLRFAFDHTIMNGNSFAEVKKYISKLRRWKNSSPKGRHSCFSEDGSKKISIDGGRESKTGHFYRYGLPSL